MRSLNPQAAVAVDTCLKSGSSGLRAPFLRIDREGKWLVATQTTGGGTRGPSSRPRIPTLSLFAVQATTSVAHSNKLARAYVG